MSTRRRSGRSRGARTAAATLALASLAATAACSDDPGAGENGRTKLTVLAASSLTEPFETLADRFEDDHPDVRVAVSFGSSATIAAQVAAGAPADVVATADAVTMAILEDDDLVVGDATVFASNQLALVVPVDNPAGIEELGDLEQADYVACVPSAPCGSLAQQVLKEAGITRPPASLEVDDKAVLTKVMLDEADAGLVYASDVVAAGGDVEQVPLPGGTGPATSYPVAVVARSEHRELADAWLELLLSPDGQQALAEAGFGAAEEGR